MASQRELAENDGRLNVEAVMGQFVDDEADHLVHVDLLGFHFDGDVRLVALEGAVVSNADGLARAIVARNGALEFGVVVLRQNDDGLVEGRPLLRSHTHDALFYGIVVRDQSAEILAPPYGDHPRRGRLQFLDQRLEKHRGNIQHQRKINVSIASEKHY